MIVTNQLIFEQLTGLDLINYGDYSFKFAILIPDNYNYCKKYLKKLTKKHKCKIKRRIEMHFPEERKVITIVKRNRFVPDYKGNVICCHSLLRENVSNLMDEFVENYDVFRRQKKIKKIGG
jgi:hypothetical protein